MGKCLARLDTVCVTFCDMARLSKSDAARIIGVTRQTLYRYLTQGRILAEHVRLFIIAYILFP